MRSGLPVIVGSFLAAVALVIAVPTSAFAAASDPAVGNDVSYPQCAAKGSTAAGTLPSGQAFAVVGVNGGIATTTNSCFTAESAWGALSHGTKQQPSVAAYVNTGDPALAAAWWPSSNKTEDGTPVASAHGTCAHKAGAACAYIYGYSVAKNDVKASHLPSGTTWWLDVETGNTWQTDTGANAASLAGMLDYFRSVGGKVGLYSTSLQWAKIAGKTSSTSALAGLPSWLAGSSQSGAPAVCQGNGLTPHSRVSLVQYHVGAFDTDLSCGVLATTTPRITGAASVGAQVRVTPSGWGPGTVTYSFQWYRSGVAIAGATKSYRTVESTDAAKSLTVVVTGHKAGYTSASVTTAAVAITKTLTATPKPTISGTFAVGKTLTLARGTWTPAPVSLHFQWLRDGVAIKGATSKTYVITSAASHHAISVSVTGTRSGYRTVTETSSAKTVS
ncbi:MAG TPA: hypothetical protein VGM94_08840 [Galbitalea sp.]|jgi:hypothetical protein